MSVHVDISEEAQAELVKQRKWNIASAWVVSLLSFILLAMIFMLTKIIMFEPARTHLDVYAVPYIETVVAKPEELRPVTGSPSPETPINVITGASASNVNIPNIPVDPLGVGTSFSPADIGIGVSMGDGMANVGEGGAGFGDGSPGGSTLKGVFYDTKLTRGKKPTNLSEAEFLKVVNNFIMKGWNDSSFNRFYQSPTPLYISHFYISKTSADEAPKAFKCPEEVKGSRWVAVYRGNVVAPLSGRFRFVGYGDDALVVRFNGKNVFDYGWYQIGVSANTASTDWQKFLKTGEGTVEMKREMRQAGINQVPMKFYKYSSTPHWNQTIGGMGVGQTFTVKEGEVYPVEVLISEIPGGAFGMCLLIEELDDKDVRKDDATGSPILNLFRTNFALPGMTGQNDNPVPFLEDSYIWRVVK